MARKTSELPLLLLVTAQPGTSWIVQQLMLMTRQHGEHLALAPLDAAAVSSVVRSVLDVLLRWHRGFTV
ncbi:hypothetical protein [Parenemella sanctibonifatiensis]|nr:hypothetical protein [Parenemella sanctibonifatiensis]